MSRFPFTDQNFIIRLNFKKYIFIFFMKRRFKLRGKPRLFNRSNRLNLKNPIQSNVNGIQLGVIRSFSYWKYFLVDPQDFPELIPGQCQIEFRWITIFLQCQGGNIETSFYLSCFWFFNFYSFGFYQICAFFSSAIYSTSWIVPCTL